MPRGVYDRSKLTKKKAAPAESSSASETPRVKRKYTKRAKTVDAVGAIAPEAVQGAGPELAEAVPTFGIASSSRFGFEFLVQQLGNLTAIKQTAGGSSGEFDTLLKKVTSQLNKTFDELYPIEQAPAPVKVVEKVKIETKVEVKTNGKTEPVEEKIEKTALPAPVPFISQNPPTQA